MIVDCTMFHWEFDVLELRMREMWDSVDAFMVTESVCDHRGNHRELVLFHNIDRFEWAKEKLYINVSEKNETALTTWDHEKYQRYRSVKDAIDKFDLNEDDFLLISDVDEIFNANAVSEMAEAGGRYMVHMPMFYYYLNLFVEDWFHPRATSIKYLTDPNGMRTGGEQDFDYIYNGGWHFGYLGTPEQIQYKLKTFAHDEFDSEEYTSTDIISQRISNRSDLFGRSDQQFSIVELEKMPRYVQKNTEKYKNFILEK